METVQKPKEEKKVFVPPAGAQPNVNRQMKTEDVTNTKGMVFSDFGLGQELQLGIYEMGFESPSPIQEEAIPQILAGRNVIAKAKNGTGKTAAFCIPLVERIDTKLNAIQALVLVPNRELAMQTSFVIKNLGKHKKVESIICTGGTSVKEDFYRLGQTVHVVVATPGRILDLASKNVAKLQDCTFLVLDEVDKLLSQDFYSVVQMIMDLMNKPQIALFSATYPQEIKVFQEKYVHKPLFIKPTEELTLKGITQYYAYLEENEKLHCLTTLFSKLEISQAMIFCSSVKRVELLAQKIQSLGFSCFYMHSRMDQKDRNRIFDDFRNGATRCLVSTDLLTRGIDVMGVNLVINFDFPKTAETYLHRIGRSGRFGRYGLAINFITDEVKNYMFQIEAELKTQVSPLPAEIDKKLYCI